MEIYDMNLLKRGNDDVFDLTNLSFQYRNDITLYSYQIQPGEEMRIDLVSESIYGSSDYIDILLHINNIDNPLNIKEGVILKYPSPDKVELYRIVEEKKSDVQNQIVNTNKKYRKDSNREKYLSQGYSLPPVVLDTPVDPVRIEGNSIVVGGSNF